MLVEELRLTLEGPSPIRAAATTMLAFVLIGMIPLSVFIYDLLAPSSISSPFLWSTLLTGVAFFLVGAAKSWFLDESWYRAAAETLAVGGAAAALAYLVGSLLGRLV